MCGAVRLRGHARQSPSCRSCGGHDRSWMRIWLPAGSRNGAVAGAVRLIGRLLDDLGVAGLDPLEGAVEVVGGQQDPAVGALGHHLGDRAPLVLGDAGVGGRRGEQDRGVGLVGRADRDPAHLAVAEVGADLEAEDVAVEGHGGLRVVVREDGGVNGEVHGGHASCRCGAGASRFLIGLVTCLATQGGMPAVACAAVAPIDAGRHADQLGEAGAEGAQRRAADLEADVGDAEVASAQQRHRSLDAPRHQVGVRRLAVGEPELPAEVPGRHVHAAGQRLDVQRLRVLPVDPVADAPQQRQVAQCCCARGGAGHVRNRAMRHGSCRAAQATRAATWPAIRSRSSRARARSPSRKW